MKKEKRYFYDLMNNEEKFRKKEWIITIFIIVGCVIAIFSLGKYLANCNPYPEETYEYLEEVSEIVVKNGSFNYTLLPKDVMASFTEKGDLELYYKSSNYKNVYEIKILVHISEKSEIQSKTRNMSSDYYKEKIYRCMLSISGICIWGLLVIILIFANFISYFNKQRAEGKRN